MSKSILDLEETREKRDITFEKSIKNLQNEFTTLISSDCYYFTQEICDQIKNINHALNNIKLDHEFQVGSKQWAKQFDSEKLKQNEKAVSDLIRKGHDLTGQFKMYLRKDLVQTKEENQLRELHSWARDNLLEYFRAIHPHAVSSHSRLDNLAHHLGVTDRYVGYRNNLTRGAGNVFDTHLTWADRKLSGLKTAGQLTPDWKRWTHAFRHYGPSATNAHIIQSTACDNVQRSNSMYGNQKTLGYLESGKRQQLSEFKRPSTTPVTSRSCANFYHQNQSQDSESIARKAGINPYFPGSSEYMDRYKKQEGFQYSPFIINPQPDFTLQGRPLTYLEPDSLCSEYNVRYAWPDASKIEKFPWLRYS
ncbi:unnamed protein product [Didymodactylos carnosus]|uniref:Uncharacterized protein n=1 Tax=Didymodactylos carnosus TaxID=1234261 RepID=A0A813T5G3_9BILA|nr:unnamed protein product [Didymodactylos carnosus]CAF0806575.1 unnamed protein product [Didymodactylos carnosus]CAF3534961.1 unnamed protein product [Didymodactylos carnosus]CAF3592023.1 unnamed protein product [Didymodactylos carnosus]